MKKPHMPFASAPGRAVAELAIIVAGVLIALAAQSWWEGRGEAQERAEALEALHVDLSTIRTRLVRDSASSNEVEEALLRVIRGDDLESLPDSAYIVTVVRAVWNFPSFNLEFPAYRELEGSGRLSLLPASVRLDLVGFLQAVSDAHVFYDDVKLIQTQHIDPWVIEVFDASRVVWSPSVGYPYPGRPDSEPLRSRNGRNRATLKYSSVMQLGIRVNQLLARTDSLQARLEGLGAGG